VGAEQQGVGVGQGVQELVAAADGLLGVDVDAPDQVGVGQLHGVVDAVAGDQCGAVGAVQFDGDLAGCVARGGDEPDFAVTTAPAAHAATTAWPARVFAPYVDTGLGNTTLTTVAADYGTKYFTLAFVDGSGCQWSVPNESGWQSQVASLQAEGGDVSLSFGGYTTNTDNTDLGATCSSAGAMATQVEAAATALGITHLDFDIESNELGNTADVALTAQALAQVRSWAAAKGEDLTISYTIPALPTGLTSQGTSVLSTSVANGFTPDIDDRSERQPG